MSGRVSKVNSGVPAWVLLFEPVALGVWCDIFVFGCVCRLLSQSSRLLICFSQSLHRVLIYLSVDFHCVKCKFSFDNLTAFTGQLVLFREDEI